jgi:hypothetical protein
VEGTGREVRRGVWVRPIPAGKRRPPTQAAIAKTEAERRKAYPTGSG